MTSEEIVESILASCPWISRENVLEKLKRERKKTSGLISDETLLRMIAVEFGCELYSSEPPSLGLQIGNVLPGLNDVTVVGRVVALFSPRVFNGNRKGKFASLLIADKSGILRVVLWNDKTSLIESDGVKVSQIVRFSHGYTREDYYGKVEVHVGEKCDVEVNPQDVKVSDFPTISQFTMKIGELPKVEKGRKVNVVGAVKKLFPVSHFERQDASTGKVLRLVLSDGSAEVPVVVWNERVDELEKSLTVNAWLQIVHGKVKKGNREGPEIHVDSTVYAEVVPQPEMFSKLVILREGLSRVNVEGEVVAKPTVREVKTSENEVLSVANFELKDETGRVWVSAWRDHASYVKDLQAGDRVAIRNAYVRKGFGDEIELSTKKGTSITKKNQ
jgi:replication factor A1